MRHLHREARRSQPSVISVSYRPRLRPSLRRIRPRRDDQPKPGWGYDRGRRSFTQFPSGPWISSPRRNRSPCRDGRGPCGTPRRRPRGGRTTGPPGLIKAGLISMAQLSGVPIVPVIVSADRAWVLKSWDHFLIPKPLAARLSSTGMPTHLFPATMEGPHLRPSVAMSNKGSARTHEDADRQIAVGRNPSLKSSIESRIRHICSGYCGGSRRMFCPGW